MWFLALDRILTATEVEPEFWEVLGLVSDILNLQGWGLLSGGILYSDGNVALEFVGEIGAENVLSLSAPR